MTESLFNKYRPKTLNGVIGQQHVVEAVTRLIENKNSRAFLLCGPSGVGKTTIARAASHLLGCAGNDIIELDAATHTGVEDMRKVQEVLRYRPLGERSHRAIIIDEAHSISKQAWDSLLKSVEEPPAHITWFFCTTNAAKVPVTIKTRCSSFTLKLVDREVLTALLEKVCKKENIKLASGVLDVIVKGCEGSPRQLLNFLDICRGAPDRRTAANLIESALDTDTMREFCQFLDKGGSWTRAMSYVDKLQEAGDTPEGIRIIVSNYFAKVARGAQTEQQAGKKLTILNHFSGPYNQSDQWAPLMMSIGNVLIK